MNLKPLTAALSLAAAVPLSVFAESGRQDANFTNAPAVFLAQAVTTPGTAAPGATSSGDIPGGGGTVLPGTTGVYTPEGTLSPGAMPGSTTSPGTAGLPGNITTPGTAGVPGSVNTPGTAGIPGSVGTATGTPPGTAGAVGSTGAGTSAAGSIGGGSLSPNTSSTLGTGAASSSSSGVSASPGSSPLSVPRVGGTDGGGLGSSGSSLGGSGSSLGGGGR